MPKRLQVASRVCVPFLIALALILIEPRLTQLVRIRPGVLPVAMASLIGLLLIPSARQMMVIVLCYGVSLLAVRDTIYSPRVPAAIDYVGIELLYPYVWALMAILAFAAGTVEAIRPGSVWARRCYFGAATLYLGGHGLINWMIKPTSEAYVLMITGVFAAFGTVYAHKIVAAENEPDPVDEDIIELQAADKRRAAMFAAHEWKEPVEELSKAH